MAFLTKTEQQTLANFCDTLIPAFQSEGSENTHLMSISATDISLSQRLEDSLERAIDRRAQKQLAQFFKLLETSFFNGLVFGKWLPFSKMNLEQRTSVLYSLATHRFGLLRKSFAGIKRLAMLIFYATQFENTEQSLATTFNYQKPQQLQANDCENRKSIVPLEVSTDLTLTCDVLVVGSGAGGGVVASELATAGHNVLVVDKGEYFEDNDFCGRELNSYERMYENYGALTTTDTSIMVFAASVIGGGTTINWTGSLRTPEDILYDWERQYGFDGISGAEYQQSLNAVSQRMNVNTFNDAMRSQNTHVFENGLRALNFDTEVIPRNVKDCKDCSFCSFGCSYGAKQNTVKTYLQDAYDKGARILARAKVNRLLHSKGKIDGAELDVKSKCGKHLQLKIKCKKVVLAAGTINSPVILLRSGLRNPHIGQHLHLHPTTVTTALFNQPVRVWEGAPMTRLTNQFANLDGRGYGVRLMNAHVHPGMFASGTAWQSGRQHKQAMQQMEYTANIITITRDFFGGQVKVDRSGNPIVKYKLHSYDAKHMMKGIQEALRIHIAAGATEVYAPHNSRPTFCNNGKQSIDTFLGKVSKMGIRTNDLPLFSAHQMSSARIAGSAKQGVANPNGETYEIKGLYITDASVLPTCSGVNPMLTISAVGHFLAQRIKSKM